MKSSSGINIGNGNNCRENRKITTSFSSSSSSAYINKRVTKTNTGLIKPSNVEQDDIKREEQQLNEFIQPASSFFTTSITSFQSESLSSKFKFEITPETINNINQHQINIQRRPRPQWITRHASLHSKPKTSSATSSILLSNSAIDLNTTTMATNLKKEILNIPNVSITQMTSKDFDDEYHRYVEQDYRQNTDQDDYDQTLKCTSMHVATDDDDDDDNDDNEKDKAFLDQASHAILTESKSKRKIKSPTHHKKIKSATRRPKLPSATQITQQSGLSSPTHRTLSQADLIAATSTKLSTSPTRIEDNNAGKNLITVDTSKARSNLDVVRMCVRDLGWKEVIK
jgi:hypothetical protein